MLRNYRRYSTSSVAPTATDVATAKVITDVTLVMKAGENPGKYEFVENSEITAELRKCKSIVLKNEVLDNGALVARADIVKANGATQTLRCFGNGKGQAVTEGALDPEAIKKVIGGFCKQDGEVIAEQSLRFDPESRTFVRFAIPYLKVD